MLGRAPIINKDSRAAIYELACKGVDHAKLAQAYGLKLSTVDSLVREERERDRERRWLKLSEIAELPPPPPQRGVRPARVATEPSYEPSRREVLRLHEQRVSITRIAALTRLPYRDISRMIEDAHGPLA